MSLTRRRFFKLVGMAMAGVAATTVASSSTTPVAAPAVPTRAGRLIRIGTSDPEGPTLDQTLPAAPFSIFWITDTQFLSESNPALFRMMTNWIVENWSSYNGKMVIHTGDLVETGSEQAEWQNADKAMSILLQHGIPYTWCAGNHDDLVGDDPSSGWNGSKWATTLDPALVAPHVDDLGYAGWVGDYHDGMNTAVSFSAGSLDFLVVNIEWNAGPDVLEWAEGLLDDPTYSGHHAIIAPHAYIDAWGSTDDPRWGTELAGFGAGLTAMMDRHSDRIFLTLNGHFATDQGYNTPSPVSSRNELMFDRQDCTDASGVSTGRGVDDVDSTTPDGDKVGGATVTILTLDSAQNTISVSTYDVYAGRWRDDPNEQYEVAMFPKSLAG